MEWFLDYDKKNICIDDIVICVELIENLKQKITTKKGDTRELKKHWDRRKNCFYEIIPWFCLSYFEIDRFGWLVGWLVVVVFVHK